MKISLKKVVENQVSIKSELYDMVSFHHQQAAMGITQELRTSRAASARLDDLIDN